MKQFNPIPYFLNSLNYFNGIEKSIKTNSNDIQIVHLIDCKM